MITFDCLERDETCLAITTKITAPFMAMCPVPADREGSLRPYSGTISVIYEPDKVWIEYDSFVECLRQQRTTVKTAEEFLQFLAEGISQQANPIALTVLLQVESSFHPQVLLEHSQCRKGRGMDTWNQKVVQLLNAKIN